MSLDSDIEKYVDGLSNTPSYNDLMRHIERTLERLTEIGKVGFGDDKNLGGRALEIRVRLIRVSGMTHWL
jgi:hypothetical protein